MNSLAIQSNDFSAMLLSQRHEDIATATAVLARFNMALNVQQDASFGIDFSNPNQILLIDTRCCVDETVLTHILDRNPAMALEDPRPLLILIGHDTGDHALYAHSVCTLPSPLQDEPLAAVLVAVLKLGRDTRLLRGRLRTTESLLGERDQFLATLSHELRNPLSTIQNLIDLLTLKPDTVAESTCRLARQVQHLRGLVDALYRFNHLKSGPGPTQELVRLDEVLEQALEIVRTKFQERGQHVRLSGDPMAITRGHRVRLVQVMANLLENASKYSPAGQHIEADVSVTDGWAVLSIKDYGDGIPVEEQTRVFEPFIRRSQHADPDASGFGLGLAIVRDIVTQHRGIVRAISEGAGTGSVFEVRLPLVSESQLGA